MPKTMLAKLPAKAKDIYEAAWDSAMDEQDDETRAAKIAIGAVKRAGYERGDDDKWHKSVHFVEMYFTKASLDPDTGEMRWSATVSKFEPDAQADEVTPDFYKSAIAQVEGGRRPMPVLCVSHVDKGRPRDAWVPGDTVEMYIDGDCPKAKGTFRDTPLGQAAFASVRDDIKNEVPHEERARISMGFYDEGSEPRETKMDDGTVLKGRRFLQGWIKHFALTRVPVVGETDIVADMEVKGMTKPLTVKDDAESIVGEELAADLLTSEKSEASTGDDLIVKAEDEEDEEGPPEPGTEREEEEEGEEPEEKANQVEALIKALPVDQVQALIKQLIELVGPDWAGAVDVEGINRAAMGSPGTTPMRAYPFSPKAEATVAFVDDFGMKVKATLLDGETDRAEKFNALQAMINAFGQDVVTMVKEGTPPSARDIADTVQDAVRQAVEPLQNELAGVKAELEVWKSQGIVANAMPEGAPAPRSMDNRVRVSTPQLGPDGQEGPPPVKKAWTARELAWESTKIPGY